MIVIVGKDKDFSHTLAEQVVRELGETCECIDALDELKRLGKHDISLVITSGNTKPEGFSSLSLAAPIRLREALSNIAAALKQPNYRDSIDITGGFTLAERAKTLVHLSGKSANLTDKEVQLLGAIAGAGSKGIGKEELLKNVWGIGADLNTHTLETHIYRLRAKFKDLSGSEMIVATDGGYIFRSEKQ